MKNKRFLILLLLLSIISSGKAYATGEVKAVAPAAVSEVPATLEVKTSAAPLPAPVVSEAPAVPAAPAVTPALDLKASEEAIKSLVEQIKNNSSMSEETLPNGIKVIFRKNTSSDLIVLRLAAKAGSVYETEKNNGLSCMLFELIKKGNAGMNAEQIARSIEQTGAAIKTDVTKTLGTATLVSTVKSFEKNFDILSECILTSNFPQAEVEKEKQFLTGSLMAENDKMDAACAKLFYKTMFAGHPYALHHYGSIDSVKNLTRNDIVQWHKTVFVPENMTFVVVGNTDFNYVKDLIIKRFGAMKKDPKAMQTFEKAKKVIAAGLKAFDAPKEAKEFKDKAQAFIYYGFITEGVDGPDYGALKMLATVLGSGMSSRLFSILRDKESLAYQITAYYQTLPGNSALISLMGTQPQKYDQALAGLKREMDRFKTELITEEEYMRAKNKLVGTYALQRNTMEDQAEFISLWEGLGLGAKFEDQYLQNVLAPTREDIRRVAQKYFDSNKFVLSVICPQPKPAGEASKKEAVKKAK